MKALLIHPQLRADGMRRWMSCRLLVGSYRGNADTFRSLRTSIRPPQYVLFQQILNDLVDDANAWPFVKPVDRTVVKDYYDVIAVPMGESPVRLFSGKADPLQTSKRWSSSSSLTTTRISKSSRATSN